jgi:hypothetical protein
MIDSVAIAKLKKGAYQMYYPFNFGPSFGGGQDTSTYGGCYDRKAFEEGRLEERSYDDGGDEKDDNDND